MTSLAWSPVDDDTANLLTTINADWRPFAEADRNTVARAICDDGNAHGGSVHPNRVRAALAALPIADQPKPTRVGPVYRALCLAGYLAFDGWDVSDDTHGKNRGKPCRTYRLTQTPSPVLDPRPAPATASTPDRGQVEGQSPWLTSPRIESPDGTHSGREPGGAA